MSDIVDRLRSQTDRLAQRYGATEVEDYPNDVDRWWWTCQDAADEIIRLRNQLDAARTGKALLALEAERNLCDQLAEALRDAMDNMNDWASYASEYFRMKHNLSGDLAEIATALAAYEAARKEGQ